MMEANITKTVWTKTVTQPIEWDLNVSDSKRDILKILSQKLTGYVSEYTVRNNLFSAKVPLCANLLYLPVGDEGIGISSISHTDTILIKEEIPASLSWDFSEVTCLISQNNPVFINSRKAGIRGKLHITLTLKENVSLPSPSLDKDLECLRETVSSYTVMQCAEEEFPLSLSFPLPQGKPPVAEILGTSLQVRNQDLKPISNKVVVKGDYLVKMLYASTMSTLETIEFSSPFTEIIDLEAGEDSCFIHDIASEISDIKIAENEENEPKTVHITGVMQLKMQSMKQQEISLITDAYSPKFPVKLLRRITPFEQLEILPPETASLKEVMALPDVQLESILDVSCVPKLTATRREDDKIVMSGDLDTTVLYQTPSGFNSISRQIPFELVQILTHPSSCESASAKLCSNHFSYNILNQNALELRLGVTAQIQLHQTVNKEYVEGILPDRDNPLKIDRAPIVAYIIKPGDTLFSIAKKYATTVDRLKAVNNIDDDRNLKVGSYLIIE